MGISERRFAIVSNGYADGPAQALRDFLVSEGATVTSVSHPLVPGGGNTHETDIFERGRLMREHRRRLPVGPPLSFALDPLIPVRLPPADIWFGFNPLACTQGLVHRRLGRARAVVYWCVDFAPDRFGRGPLTRLYDRLDSLSCRSADARFELSEAARQGRDSRHAHPASVLAPTRIVPMGAWLDRVPTVPEDGWRRRRVVFLGHLVERQGVGRLLEAMKILGERSTDITATVVGSGPLETDLRALADRLGLGGTVTFTGFVEDHREVEALLADASLAVAPYLETPDSFTRYADPGKLKAYLAAGLPIVLTAVPPNAQELAASAGGQIVPGDALSLADAIETMLALPAEWQARRRAALEHALSFDWATLLADAVDSVLRRIAPPVR